MKKTNIFLSVILILAATTMPFLGVSQTADGERRIYELSLQELSKPVHPGDQVVLHLETHGEEIQKVFVVSAPEMLLNQLAPSRDGHLIVKVPIQAKSGRYKITVMAIPKGGRGMLTSNKIDLVVSMNNRGEISISGGTLRLRYPGSVRRVKIRPEADYSYSIKDPAIAIVDAHGYVTGEAPGKTEITVSYKDERGTISRSIPIAVGGELRGDLNDDHKIDERDVSELKAWIGDTVNGPNDVRDLDHDGRITEKDVELLNQLCTYPECASRMKRGVGRKETSPASDN